MSPVPIPPDVTWLRNLVRTQHGLDEHGALNVIARYEEGLAAARAEVTRLTAERDEAKELIEQAEVDTERKVSAETRGRIESLAARCALLENALREIAGREVTALDDALARLKADT